MPDVISGVIIAPRNLRYYCLAMAKIDKNPETNKEKRKKITQNLQNRRYFSDFITDLHLLEQNFVILQIWNDSADSKNN